MKETKRQQDKERENILPLCQYNIYANHAFSMCVNFIKQKEATHSWGGGGLKP